MDKINIDMGNGSLLLLPCSYRVMPYQFDFDLTKVSRSFFREVAEAAHRRRLHRRIGDAAVHLLERCKIQEITGLDFAQALTLLEDFIDIQMKNVRDRERFLKTSKRVLLLPHCSRKFMDNRCKAVFDPKTPSYSCSHCSPDCLVNQATTAGEEKNYDVYVLPGGSCIHRILERGGYEGLVGVACGEEIRLADGLLDRTGLPGQNVPLIKNGCANTTFSIDTLQKIL
jgi:hypothetical protein